MFLKKKNNHATKYKEHGVINSLFYLPTGPQKSATFDRHIHE